MAMKNPLTPAGIEPATYRFVAQHLNHCATAVPQTWHILSVFPLQKCSLFHNSNVFGSCIIHILYTGCAKIKKNNCGAKRLRRLQFCRQIYEKFSNIKFRENPASGRRYVACGQQN